ncbi:DUF1698 domain-containing protein [Sphingomonas sp.]|uniref:DUF1698 domain-containing protein n=1 Tax=Sphingomonas sp. TaxID=28214 RepID=UPI000DB14DC3|nr:DUF1698 domain-containing protein [Sphingomonas sp.]PZU10326.1 MAG: hypothetical protein DI605_07055 [Sphingomonas sp.]
MINSAPIGFSLDEFYRDIYLFQKWEIFPGHVTEAPKDVSANLAAMNFPTDLAGKRVLDIAPWNGFFSFECARRGAREVVSLGPEDPTHTGFQQTKDLLGLTNVHYVRDSIYNLTVERYGTFDVVLFLGLIYHLRHPLLALDRIYDVCDDTLYSDTPTIDRIIYDKTLTENQRTAILDAGSVIHQLPMLYYTGNSETGDAFNWFMPNMKGFRALIASSGFNVTHQSDDGGGWSWISATKSERHFEIDLEGYNPHAARR